MTEIQTTRLRLIPLNLQNLLLLKENRALMENNLGLALSQQMFEPHTQIEFANAVDFWIDQVMDNEENYPWFTNWEVVLKEKNVSIGGIGLTGKPNKQGQVMVGYGIDGNYHNRGFATESLQAMIGWIFAHPEAKSIHAETRVYNHGSQRVLLKNGFKRAGQYEDYYHWILYRPSIY